MFEKEQEQVYTGTGGSDPRVWSRSISKSSNRNSRSRSRGRNRSRSRSRSRSSRRGCFLAGYCLGQEQGWTKRRPGLVSFK